MVHTVTKGPIEVEEADLSALSLTLPTPDVERRDVTIQERTKRDGPGKHCHSHVLLDVGLCKHQMFLVTINLAV